MTDIIPPHPDYGYGPEESHSVFREIKRQEAEIEMLRECIRYSKQDCWCEGSDEFGHSPACMAGKAIREKTNDGQA